MLTANPKKKPSIIMKMTSVRFRDWSEPALVVDKNSNLSILSFLFESRCYGLVTQ